MKTALHKLTAIVFLFIGMTVLAGEPKFNVVKEKTVKKVYQVNLDAGIDITNKFGNIYVTTWNEDKIAIDVIIKVSGKSESKVQARLDKIGIEINPLTHLVSAKTIIEPLSTNNINMEINYTIKIPKRGSVTLKNQFGNIVLDKISERSDIDCKYGNVTIEELQGDNNSIKIKYCDKVSIGYLKSGTINTGYSSVSIAKSGNLIFNGNYSDLNVKDAANVSYSLDYGNVTLTSANSIKGNGNYLNIKLGTLNGALDIDTRYSTVGLSNVSSKAKNINLTTAYTNIDLKFDADYAFDYEFSFKYGGINNSILNHQIARESGSSSYYKGFYKSSGNNQVTVSSSYGTLKLNKN